jgi:hypothetical protein
MENSDCPLSFLCSFSAQSVSKLESAYGLFVLSATVTRVAEDVRSFFSVSCVSGQKELSAGKCMDNSVGLFKSKVEKQSQYDVDIPTIADRGTSADVFSRSAAQLLLTGGVVEKLSPPPGPNIFIQFGTSSAKSQVTGLIRGKGFIHEILVIVDDEIPTMFILVRFHQLRRE